MGKEGPKGWILGFLRGFLYNGSMKKRQPGYCEESEWFYKLYASENQMDYLQLCLLDLLRTAGGMMTWKNLYAQLPYSAVSIRLTVSDLEEQQLLHYTPDCLFLSETACFVVDEILDDLHTRLNAAFEGAEDSIPNLMA